MTTAATDYHAKAREFSGYKADTVMAELACLDAIGAKIAEAAKLIAAVKPVVASKGSAVHLATLMAESLDAQFEPREWAVIREAATKDAAK